MPSVFHLNCAAHEGNVNEIKVDELCIAINLYEEGLKKTNTTRAHTHPVNHSFLYQL